MGPCFCHNWFRKRQLKSRRGAPGIIGRPHYPKNFAWVFRCHIVVHLEHFYSEGLNARPILALAAGAGARIITGKGYDPKSGAIL